MAEVYFNTYNTNPNIEAILQERV